MAHVWWISFITLVFTVSQTQAGVRDWYYRCCTRGHRKAKRFNGDFQVCEKDDLDQRRFNDPMDRMICRMGERMCCMRTLQKLSCEQGKYQAYQGKSCKRRHGYSGSDRFVHCCDCCALGLKTAQERYLKCSDVQIEKNQHCATVFRACCSGKNGTIPPGPVYTLPPVKPTTSKSPHQGGCNGYGCEHICREDRSKTPVCYCYAGYLIGNDGKTCVDINECLMRDNECKRQKKRCLNTPGSYRCVDKTAKTTTAPTSPPKQCPPGHSFKQGRCQDIDECASGSSPCGGFAECINTKGAYRCAPCRPGHRLQNNKCEDIDECKERRFRCRRDEVCQNTKGSYTCVRVQSGCPAGHRKQGDQCIDIDECKERRSRCASHELCVNTKGSYTCRACPSGHRKQGNQCADIDECQERRYRCRRDEVCQNTVGSYTCVRRQVCPPGHRKQGDQCIDIDECKERRYRCGRSEICKNTVGSYTCEACPSGHRRQRDQCVDIDECQERRYRCARDTVCKNTKGSYTCIRRQDCPPGHTRRGGRCVDIDECRERRYRCPRDKVCKNTVGSYSCQACPSGFRPRAEQCVDINECVEKTHDCPADKDCQNTRGSYTCVDQPRQGCLKGYSRNRLGQCEDINECKYLRCPLRHECKNLPGSYECVAKENPDPCSRLRCPNGYRCKVKNNKPRCEDIDECLKNPCKKDETCKNIPGHYYCLCPKGYKRFSGYNYCEDINECRFRVCQHRCTNTRGSYKCSCRNGYQLVGTSQCVNINECQTLKPCQSKCIDTQGSYECACEAGYKLDTDKRSCKDINECVEGRGRLCIHQCVNTPGSFKCVCRSGWKLAGDGYGCEDVDECINDPNICSSDRICVNTFGSHDCISFPCPPPNLVSRENRNYYRLDTRSLCKKDNCLAGDKACFDLKDKAYQFWTFIREVRSRPGDLFAYRIVLQDYADKEKVKINYYFRRGNEEGLFEIQGPTKEENRIFIRNRYAFPKAATYKLEFVGEVFYDSELVSRYVHYLYVYVYGRKLS